MNISEETWILIPAYNVDPYIKDLIVEILHYIPRERILVVDDGSVDSTLQIVKSTNVKWISHKSNRGKGAALMSGFDYLRDQKAEWVITIDGDLQHDPRIIPELINKASNSDCDVIIGSRRKSGTDMPWDRRFSNWSTSRLLSILCGQTIKDAQSGYRMIRIGILKGISFSCVRYDFETEFLLKTSGKGAKFGWIEIPTKYHGSLSSINRITDTARFIEVVAKHQWEKWKKE